MNVRNRYLPAFTLFMCFVFSLLANKALARQTLVTYAADGRPLFVHTLYDKGEVFGLNRFDNAGQTSAWTPGSTQRAALQYAGEYWSSLLGDAPTNTSPAPISVGTYKEENADAESPYSGRFTELANAVLNNTLTASGPLAQIRIGFLSPKGIKDYTGPLRILPVSGDSADLTVALVHEIGHAMGIGSTTVGTDIFAQTPAAWDRHLVDSFGNPARPGLAVKRGHAASPDAFVIDATGYDPDYGTVKGYAYFQGPNTMEVLGGTGTVLTDARNFHNIPGVPINGIERNHAELSHIELRNGMMSHQNYSNWGTYMEAELAMLQDIGIPLDRKNFYGTSIYTDNGAYEITRGFFARNNAGTAYLPGTYNPTPLAIGLHIYGAGNTVTMKGDVLTSGFGSMGIRIDGWSNDLTVAPGVKIHASGENATGLSVAYGSGQALTLRGDVSATGAGGIGLRLDFGDNQLGNTTEYRGSFIRTDEGDNADLSEYPELVGALVDNVNVTGSVAGSAASIFIARNAYVEEINIMRGARLEGDIISRWNPGARMVQYGGDPADLTTDLTFGHVPDNTGRSTYTADTNFFLDYRNDITGPDSLNVRLAGGTLAYGGSMRVRSFTADTGTTLLVPAAGQKPVLIHADSVALDSGSTVGVFTDTVSYGAPLPAKRTALRLEGGSVSGDAAVRQPSGTFIHGFYDYTITGLGWEDDGAARDLVLGTDRSFSRERAATSAITAPTAIMVQNPYASLLRDHASAFFARTSAAPSPGLAMPTASGEESRSAVSLWLAPSYGDSRRNGSGKYTLRSPGVAFGGDMAINGDAFLGVGAYLAKPYYRSDDTDIDADSVTALVYGGTRLPLGLELDAFAAAGHTWYDQDRSVHGEKYDTDYSGNHFGGGLSLGRSFDLAARVMARPFASYEYMHLHVGGYNERSSGYFGLDVGKSRSDLHRLNVGTSVAYALDGGFVEGKVFYSGLYGDRKPEADIAMTRDASGYSMTSKGWAQDEHSAGVGLGFGVDLGESAQLSGGYSFIGGEKVTSHQAELQLSISF